MARVDGSGLSACGGVRGDEKTSRGGAQRALAQTTKAPASEKIDPDFIVRYSHRERKGEAGQAKQRRHGRARLCAIRMPACREPFHVGGSV